MLAAPIMDDLEIKSGEMVIKEDEEKSRETFLEA